MNDWPNRRRKDRSMDRIIDGGRISRMMMIWMHFIDILSYETLA